MTAYVLGFDAIDRSTVAVAGGKAVHLAEISRIDGIRVPVGFCVTTAAFERAVAHAASPDDLTIPDDVAAAIAVAHAGLGEHAAYAVRSSATAEDLPTASFAGQHDTFLNVVGLAEVLRGVVRCWASLFSERAIAYRLRAGVDPRNVQMAVVVQRMVFPQSAGILFTADPVTGNRNVACVEATFGLGEALVGGLVNADAYQVRDGAIVARTIGSKQLAIHASAAGGTQQAAVEPERQTQPALTDRQVVRLAQLGRRIEAHLGRPQDIEWCLVDDDFHIVQSRPITTLFPIPEVTDGRNHVYISVGHQQMMTDAIKPLGLSIWQRATSRPMVEAGGRLFVDVTQALAVPASRAGLIHGFARTDPLVADALSIIVDRGDFIATLPGAAGSSAAAAPGPAPAEIDPAVVSELIEGSRASIEACKREIRGKTGVALLDFIVQDIQTLRQRLWDPKSMQAIMAGMEAAWWLDDHLATWLGEKNAADPLVQSVPDNVTSQMGLALLDVADVIRPYPEVTAFLEQVDDERFVDALAELAGGRPARAALCAWLDAYGMRGVGEIDITRPRFGERPTMLLPMLLGNIRNFEHGAAQRRFEHGLRTALQHEQTLLARLRATPDGEHKAEEAKRMIDRVRTFAGYREYPKYALISRQFVYKQALLQEAERLVHAGVLADNEDIFYLRLEELHQAVRTRDVDPLLVAQRRDAFRTYQTLVPPRVLTSDGEAVAGAYRRDDCPAGALVGLAACAGIVQGRARVIHDVAHADLKPDDILVTAFTDPSWTPLFVAVKGLVTEVGGRMTHGAVIAREYGLPAVVGVHHATKRIADGQRIRVNGTHGYIEILS